MSSLKSGFCLLAFCFAFSSPSIAGSAIPPNDNFEKSGIAFGTKATLSGNNIGATSEPREPLHAGIGGGHSVWWKWVAPASGYVTLSPNTNSVVPVIGVYTGTELPRLKSIASSQLGAVSFAALKGKTYHIAVDGREDFFDLNLLLSAIRLIAPKPGSLFYVGNPIWLTAQTTVLDGDGQEVQFYAGSELLGVVTRSQPKFSWTNAELGIYELTAKVTASDGTERSSKPVTIQVRPPNDDFAHSALLQGLNVATNGTTLGASKERHEPTSGDPAADASVWYSWTPQVSGPAVVSIQEDYFSSHPIGVYVGRSASKLVSLGESVYDFYPVGFVAHAGITYRIAVKGFSNDSDTGARFGLSISQQQAPANDDFANRIFLSGDLVETNGSNVGATSEPGEFDGVASLWWSWEAPATGSLYVTGQGDTLGPVFTFYTGTSLSKLQYVGSAPSWYYGTEASGEIHVQKGQTYQIMLVGTYAHPIGTTTLGLRLVPSPDNDNFANGSLLTGAFSVSLNSNITASAEAGETNSNGRSVWWHWTAPQSGPVSLSTDGSSFQPWLSVYTGTRLTELSLVTNALEHLTFNAVAGKKYRISADANGGGQVGQITLTLVAGPPSNDTFNNRLALVGTNVTTIGSTVGASLELLEPEHGAHPGSNSIWWTWTAPSEGTLTISVLGDGFSPTWAVYNGSSLDSLSLLADSYDLAWGVRSSTAIPVHPGIPLQIAVDGSSEIGIESGIVRVSLSFVGLPSNDNFADRVPLSGTSVHVIGDTSGATREPGEPDHAGYGGGHSIWWSWTAPASGRVTLDAFGSAVTTLAAVYTGNTVSSLTNITSGNATFAAIEFECEAGATYQVALDHWSSDIFGAVNLNLVFSSLRLIAPTNELVVHGASPVLLIATNTSWDGTFTEMDFLANDTLIGTVANPPYAFTWDNPALGNHAVKVRITDSTGNVRFSPEVKIHVRPINDDFSDRIPITQNSAVLHATGINGTLEDGEPVHGPVNWESVWWTWTAPDSGRVTLSKPSDIQLRFVLLDVYTGSNVSNLKLVTNTPANGSGTLLSSISFNTQKDTQYHFAVAGSFFDQNDLPITFDFTPKLSALTVSPLQSISVVPISGPFMTQPDRSASSHFTFVLNGESGSTYSVLVSTNLFSPASEWSLITTTNLVGNSATIEDAQATNNVRFYRVRVER